MNPSIRSMNWTIGQIEQAREQAERERRERIQRERDEIAELQDKIWHFGFDQNAEKYDAWMTAGPNSRSAYLEYCRTEWARIVEEIKFAHRLAGFILSIG